PARAASRGAMRDALAAGPPEARPTQLAAPGLDLEAPVYTLRGFEQAEARFLARGGRHEPPLSHLPVALWTPERYAEIVRHVPLDRLLPDPEALGKFPADVVAAGLCHVFIDYYAEVRDDVLPFVPATARDVLEIGCGRGLTGELLQRTLGCRVTGVELNPEVAKDAGRRLYAVRAGDVQTLDLGGPFDVV